MPWRGATWPSFPKFPAPPAMWWRRGWTWAAICCRWPTPPGVRQTRDVIEAEGVRRALSHAAGGMTLLLLDGSLADPRAGLPPDLPEPDLIVWNKSTWAVAHDGISLSLKTGDGVSELIKMLQQKVQQKLESKDGAPPLTRPRHRHALGEALGHLQPRTDGAAGSARIAGGRFAAGDARHRPHHRPGGCGGAAGFGVP